MSDSDGSEPRSDASSDEDFGASSEGESGAGDAHGGRAQGRPPRLATGDDADGGGERVSNGAPRRRRASTSSSGGVDDEDGVNRPKKTVRGPLDDVAEGGEGATKKHKPGIVYLASVPPFMKVGKVRHLMEQFGRVGRIYLVPEDAAQAKRRKQSGGNRKQRFTEGWVEFERKKVAKAVAESLNATIIGGKKRSFYHDDIWNIKYLPHFKWSHLTEKIAYENRVREQRLRAAISQSRRETAFYLSAVDQAQKVKKMEERKSQKAKSGTKSKKDADAAGGGAPAAAEGARSGAGAPSGAADAEDHNRIRRRFKQREALSSGDAVLKTSLLKRVMGGNGEDAGQRKKAGRRKASRKGSDGGEKSAKKARRGSS